MPGKDRELIAGLAKGLAIIEAFETSRASLTVSEAAELAGLSRAAARRCLRTLQLLGHVEAENNKFKLTPRVLRLARAYVSSTPLPRVVQPIVEAMSQRLHHFDDGCGSRRYLCHGHCSHAGSQHAFGRHGSRHPPAILLF